MTSGTDGADDGDGWAKTVVDGVSEVASDDAGAASNEEPGDPIDAEIVEGEVLDAEIVDGDVLDGDVLDGDVLDGDVLDGDVTDAEIVDGDVIDGDSVDGDAIDAEIAEILDAGAGGGEAIGVEDLVADLERVSTERDQYLDASRRLQAEFENYKKQVAKREADARERANDSLISDLLPVLDAFDGALAAGTEDVSPMRATVLDALGKQGLERIDPVDAPFDPNLHEAVLHEDDAETDGPVVAEVMRAGYAWKGRVLRPAMVKTRG